MHLEQLMDIRFYDESYYLCQGVFHPPTTWEADYSALYSLFYKGLSLVFGSDAVFLYYISYRIWAFFLGFLVFYILWKQGVHYGISLAWALCSLSAEINYPLWPKAGHLAMAGIAVALFGVKKLSVKNPAVWLWCSGICLLLSWVRPEFLSACIPGFLIFLFKARKDMKSVSGFPLWVFVPLLVSVFCLILWGIPGGNSGRGLVAFGQHYVHNWRNISGNNQGDLMWDWVNWREIFFRDFPGAENFFQALTVNPEAFFSHIFFNAKHLLYKAFVYFFESLFPNRWLGLPVTYSVAIVWLLLEISVGFEGGIRWWKKVKPQTAFLLHPVLLLMLPSFLAGLLFQPRPHYLIPWFPVFLWITGSFLSCFSFPRFSAATKNILSSLLVLTLIFFLPDASAFFKIGKNETSENHRPFLSSFNFFEPETRQDLRQKMLIGQMQNFPWSGHTILFDASTGAADFLGTRLIKKGKTGFELDYERLADFRSFVEKEKVNAIFIRPSTIRYDRKINADPYWQKLKASWAEEGWKKIPVGSYGDSLLLRAKP